MILSEIEKNEREKMNFGSEITELRKKNDLTQEQLAEKLNVTRQAVSNWENDRNLPDIEMLIRISDEFDVSLDELIKGGETMNNMTEKIIDDGSEGRRAKRNMITAIIGALLMLAGAACFIIKANSVEYIDADGILHENFFLLPIGFLFLLCGVVVFLIADISFIVNKVKKSKQERNDPDARS